MIIIDITYTRARNRSWGGNRRDGMLEKQLIINKREVEKTDG